MGPSIYGFKDGERVVQLGGRWTELGQSHTKALASEHGIAVKLLWAFADAASERGGDLYVAGAARIIAALAEGVPLAASWDAPDTRALDGKTLASYLDEMFEPELSPALGSILMGFLPEPQECSLLQPRPRWHPGLDGPRHDNEIFEGGAHELTDRLAVLVGDRVQLETLMFSLQKNDVGIVAHTSLGAFAGRHPKLSNSAVVGPKHPSNAPISTYKPLACFPKKVSARKSSPS